MYLNRGLSPRIFAEMFASKLNVHVDALSEAMWGDFYFNSKLKRCDEGAFAKGKSTIFSQMILENIWSLYNNVMFGDMEKIIEFCEKLKLKYRPAKTTSNRKTILKSICMEWLPLHKIIFEKIVEHVKCPSEMFNIKLSKLIRLKDNESINIQFTDDDSFKMIAYICKMVPITYRELQACDKSLKNVDGEYQDNDQVLIAFARIYSGVLKQDSKVHLVKSNYDPILENFEQLEPVTIKRIYLMMGKNFVPIIEAHKGMIVGIWGLQDHVIKTATLASTVNCPPFNGLDLLAPPVVRVAVEPKNVEDMLKLVKGLKILNQVDSCVQIMIQETGEHVLCVLGEVHLEKCIRDLKENYAKIELNVSKPIVQFRETIVMDPTVKPTEILDSDKSITIKAWNNACTIKMVALPLPSNVVQFLENKQKQLKVFLEKFEDESRIISTTNDFMNIQSTMLEEMSTFLNGIISEDEIWSVGPKKLSTCMLINKSQYKHLNFWSSDAITGNFDRAVINGFQTAVQSGPICHEPMHGVCFVMEEFSVDETYQKNESSITGIIITAVKEACRLAFQKQAQRLVGPMYNLNIIANADVLGE